MDCEAVPDDVKKNAKPHRSRRPLPFADESQNGENCVEGGRRNAPPRAPSKQIKKSERGQHPFGNKQDKHSDKKEHGPARSSEMASKAMQPAQDKGKLSGEHGRGPGKILVKTAVFTRRNQPACTPTGLTDSVTQHGLDQTEDLVPKRATDRPNTVTIAPRSATKAVRNVPNRGEKDAAFNTKPTKDAVFIEQTNDAVSVQQVKETSHVERNLAVTDPIEPGKEKPRQRSKRRKKVLEQRLEKMLTKICPPNAGPDDNQHSLTNSAVVAKVDCSGPKKNAPGSNDLAEGSAKGRALASSCHPGPVESTISAPCTDSSSPFAGIENIKIANFLKPRKVRSLNLKASTSGLLDDKIGFDCGPGCCTSSSLPSAIQTLRIAEESDVVVAAAEAVCPETSIRKNSDTSSGDPCPEGNQDRLETRGSPDFVSTDANADSGPSGEADAVRQVSSDSSSEDSCQEGNQDGEADAASADCVDTPFGVATQINDPGQPKMVRIVVKLYSSERKRKVDGSGQPNSATDKAPAPTQSKVIDILESDFKLLEQHKVRPVKTTNKRQPHGVFCCILCDLRMNSVHAAKLHVNEEKHLLRVEQEKLRTMPKWLPIPVPDLADAVGRVVNDCYLQYGLSPDRMEMCRGATFRLKTFVEASVPGASVRQYGSYMTGLGLKESSVDVELVSAEAESKTANGLTIVAVLRVLRQAAGVWADVQEDFGGRIPVVHFRDVQLGVRFSLTAWHDNAYKTSILLQRYALFDSRFILLTVAFRVLFRMCAMDQPDMGAVPPHSCALMVLYYLQQENIVPVIPATDDYISMSTADVLDLYMDWKPDRISLGYLWLGLLKFYAYSFSYDKDVVNVRSAKRERGKGWRGRFLALEDPFHDNANVASTMNTTMVNLYYMDCLRVAMLYFWIPQLADGPLFVKLLENGVDDGDDPLVMTQEEARLRVDALDPRKDLVWRFHPANFTRGQPFPLVCCVCNKDGHVKQQCPKLFVQPVGAIPPPDFEYLKLLDNVCVNIFGHYAQRERDIANREKIRSELEDHIRCQLYKEAKLTMFGSSCNGFGFANSDLDLCFTLESDPDGKCLDAVATVHALARLLRSKRSLVDVIAISSAKVPIVKFRHSATRIESDISVYNLLGQRNSQLLATYAAIDARVRIIGYMAKLLAKRACIGDASRGSLSSYAYTLMVIHYLQQVKPPIIPVLQEIPCPAADKRRYIIEGCDTWFYSDLKNLIHVWPHYGANREGPSTLWLGFLLYYAELFDFRQQVVCIRRLQPLYRLEKKWTDKPIAIEDPFDLSHNLGQGISPLMGTFIRRVFVKARRHFQTPVNRIPEKFRSLEEYLFYDGILIPDGPPVNTRGCLLCGKIGHLIRECPGRRQRFARDAPRAVQRHGSK